MEAKVANHLKSPALSFQFSLFYKGTVKIYKGQNKIGNTLE